MNTEAIEILFEDDAVVVINKPSGIMVHADGRSENDTVVEWLLTHAPEVRGVGEKGVAPDGTILDRSGIVHRLDRDTSGVMVLTKTQESFDHLKKQFHDKLAKKEYRAFVYGTMKEKWGTVDRPIGRSAKDFRLKSAQRGAKGTLRESITDWELIDQNEEFAYLKLFPRTGRTHQIRVHLKAIGRSVVGDTLYAPKDLIKKDALGIGRLALHAHTLTFAKLNGEEATFTAELPKSFEVAIDTIAG